MQQWWQQLGIQLGKQWKIVAGIVAAITVVLVAVGLPRLDFATGQESYLNDDSQIAIDNELFQDMFGGEAIVMMFIADDAHDIADLYREDNGNLAELQRVRDELGEIPEVRSVVDPLTTLTFSHNIVSDGAAGVAGQALLAAVDREEAGSPEQQVRQADIPITLGRLGAIPEDQQEIGNPAWNEFLIFDNTGFAVEDGEVIPPDDPHDRAVRKSLRGVFPEHDGAVQQHVVGGLVLKGNATLDEMSDGTVAALDILDTVDVEGFELVVAGSPIYLKEINDYLRGGMLTLGGAAILVMAIILIVMFRVRWRLLSLAACIIGILWAFSLFGLIGLSLSLVTIAGLPILIGLGIDFAIQIHNRVEEEVVLDHDEHPIQQTLANVGPALVAATVAAVVAFIALQASLVPMIRDFGVLLAIGVVVMLVVGIVVAATTLGIREYKEPTGERKVSLVERITVKLGSLPTKLGAVFIAAAVLIFGIGIIVEGGMKIESDPLKWVNPDSPAVQSVHRLEDETGFSTTMGVLVQANNVADQDVVDVLHQFVTNIESRDDGAVVATSSLVTTMMKILDIDGATPLAPRAVDVANAAAVAPRDVQQALFHLCDPGDPVCDEVVPEDITVEPVRDEGQPVMTATQVNMRLAPASLDVRAELVTELQDELDALIAQAGIEPGSILLAELDDADADVAIKATPSGLAVVGTGLLENLTANRAGLTYLALAAAALWLVIRLRSLARAFFTLIPVGIAVGASSIVIGGVGLTLSPMTTVSGPLVIATCVEFSVLITARYLEERQRGLDPEAAGDRAAGRTGRAFFTSAATTIGGFAVLIGSALPLLRDFGIIVTLNVAIALLAALVVMPPLVKWADGHGWLGTGQEPGAVKLAAPPRRNQLVGAVAGFVLLLVAFGGILVALDRPTGAEATAPYSPISLPAPPEPEPEDEEPAEDEEPDEDDPGDDPAPADDVPDVDPDDFGDELSAEAAGTTIGPILHGLLTAQDVDPHVATCTVDTLMSEYTDAELLAMGAAQLSDEVVAVVTPIASACGIDQATIDAVIEAGL